MKINISSKPSTAWACAVAVIIFQTLCAPAAQFTLSINQSAAGDWTQSIWGSPTAVAVAGNDYLVPATFFLRTVNTSAGQTFAGDNLILTNGGVLYLKHASGVANVNLVLSGGQVIGHGGGVGTMVPLGGKIQVLTDTSAQYTLGSDQASGNRDLWLYSNISGTGNLIVNMLVNAPNALALFGTNSGFTGNWTNDNGTIEIRSGSVDALGSGSVSLTKTTSFLSFNTTNTLSLTNSIGGIGSVLKLNTNTVTLNGVNSFTGFLSVSNGVLKIGANSSITNPATLTLANGTLDVGAIGGLMMNTLNSQTMNCNGTLVSNLTASSGNNLRFNLTASTNDILNITGNLTLNGNPTLTLFLSGFKPSGTYRLINYSGTIQGGGSFTLVPPVGSSEGFALDTSTPGQVNVIVTGSQRNLTWVGDGSGNNWDTGSANWTGDSTVFGTGDNVLFNDSGSASPNINVTSASLFPSSVTISNTVKQYTFQGSGITTVGTLTKLGNNELDFSSPGNNFSGPIVIQSGTLSVGVGGSFGSLGTGPITNNGVLQVNMAANAVAFNAPITGSGSLNITGGGVTVTIGGAGNNSYAGLTTIGDGCQLNIATSTALGLTNSGTIVQPNGRLGVASFVGSMTVFEPVQVSGTGINGAPGALYVNTTGNNVTWAGPISIVGSTQFRAVNPNARMNFSNVVAGADVALECTAGNGAVTTDTNAVIAFQNTLSLGTSGSLNADGPGIVILGGNSNLCNNVDVNAGTLLVNGRLNAVSSVNVNNSSILGGTGTIFTPVTVQSGATLAPGITIGTLSISNTVTLSGTNLMELNRTNAQNADLLAASSLDLSGSPVLTVVNAGPALQANDTFQLFTGARSGSFAVTNLPALSSTNLFWDVSLFQSQGVLKVGSFLAPTPTNLPPQIIGTNFVFQVSPVSSGFNYVLQATPVLNPPVVWTNIRTNPGAGAPLSFTNPISPGATQLFFRILIQ